MKTGGDALPTVLLDPETVTATYHYGVLTVTASGEEDGFQNIRIVRLPSPETIVPATFCCSVQGEPTPAIGMFPYRVGGTFDVAGEAPRVLELRTRLGAWRTFPIG